MQGHQLQGGVGEEDRGLRRGEEVGGGHGPRGCSMLAGKHYCGPFEVSSGIEMLKKQLCLTHT